MVVMKRLAVLLFTSGVVLCAAELASVRSVYVMPMARGLDQHLANRLTGDHVFQIVTDPKQADAILSDRIGEAFQSQLERLLPPPPKPAPAKAEKGEKAAETQSKLITETENKLDNPALNSAFGRGKGTIFLVDVKSSQVLWSTYQDAPANDGKTLDLVAGQIVGRLKKDLAPASSKKK
jgi:hypothetical protein